MNAPDDIAPGNNPDRLTNAQVGDGYRLLTTEEIEARDIVAGPLMAEETIECWGNGCWHSGYVGHALDFTYRVLVSAGSFMPVPPKPEINKDALLAEMADVLCSYHHATISAINAVNGGDLSEITQSAQCLSGVAGRGASILARYREATK